MSIAIVGGGIAGTLMAARLVFADKVVVHFDPPDPYAASKVAAGMFNTVTGQRASLTWQAGLLTDRLFALFAEPWATPLRQYLHLLPVYRPFRTVAESNEWTGWAADYPQLITVVDTLYTQVVNNPMGGIVVNRTGWLDVPAFLIALKALLHQTERYRLHEEAFSYNELTPAAMDYEAVVFAEGPGVLQNPWWPSAKQVQPLKGQLLELSIPHTLAHTIVNKVYLAPVGAQVYRCGSTYERQYDTPQPTEAGKAEVLDHLHTRLLQPGIASTVLGQLSGIRPTSPDRKPLLGKHPDYPLYFLNGMGTKGVLQVPWCTEILRDFILQATPLPKAVDLHRWTKTG